MRLTTFHSDSLGVKPVQRARIGDGQDVGKIAAVGANRHADNQLRHRWRRRLARTILLATAVILALAMAGAGYELALPSVANAPARVAAILSAHGGELAGLPLPTKLAEAIVSVEDEHFYSNILVNVADGAGRAAVATLKRSGDPGGSTIEQQLAKQLYPHRPGLAGTLSEIGLGVKLALTYSKPRILAMYLNAIYYGNGYWGEEAAALGYFGVKPSQLTWAEAAMLAGLPQAPSAYDPLRHLALAKQRQGHVLDQLVVNHLLTARQAYIAYRAPLPLRSAGQ
ncbi:MAG: hypothetical protein EPN30_06970 [Actinomycetota bacterium]|nr:MAG: hypothetical protein EPN30_06970 [Actinomycetota bacterium]